jgi:hypothetical protein
VSTATASDISITVNSTTHDATITATQTFADGTTSPITIQLPGYRYDLTVTLIQELVNPAAWTANFASLTPSAVSTWIGVNPGATMAQLMTYIVTNSGTVADTDVARFWCETENVLKAPKPVTAPSPPTTDTATNITL